MKFFFFHLMPYGAIDLDNADLFLRVFLVRPGKCLCKFRQLVNPCQ